MLDSTTTSLLQVSYVLRSSPSALVSLVDGVNISQHVLNTTLASTDCIVLQQDEFKAWDNPDNIVSFQVEDNMRKAKDLFFLPVLFLIGCPANVINMAVFYKQGLKERINVSLFALSLADELHLVNNMIWFGEQLVIQFTSKETYGPVLRFLVNNYLTGFHGFIFVSQILTAIIASDRCYCILQPLRAQTVLRSSTMVYIITAVNIVIICFCFIIITRYHVTCSYDPITKQTMFINVPGEFYLRHEKFVIYLDVFVFGVGVPGVVMLVVALTTAITMVKLREAATWRAGASSSSAVTHRDDALTKMLVANSIFFLICVFPFVVFRLVFLFMPDVNTGRRHHNFYMTIQWSLLVVSFFNSTFNIVVYYTMGSRYRETFWKLFARRRPALCKARQ